MVTMNSIVLGCLLLYLRSVVPSPKLGLRHDWNCIFYTGFKLDAYWLKRDRVIPFVDGAILVF